MIAASLPLLTFLALLGAGLNAGVYFIFSVCIMGALGRLTPEQGVSAMQSINMVIINPWFMAAFLGTALISLLLIVGGFITGGAGGGYLIAGGLFYIIGTILVTMIFNVPMNNAIEAATAGSDAANALWSKVLVDWVNWNHVRTIASTASLGLFAMAFRNI